MACAVHTARAMVRTKWLAMLSLAACVAPGDEFDDGKSDTGWLADDSFEVGGVVRGSVTRSADGDWADLATSEALQISLVDTQIKFGKNAMAAKGWHLDQLTDGVKILGVESDNAKVTVRYEATIDMIHAFDGKLPALASLDPRRFSLKLPV